MSYDIKIGSKMRKKDTFFTMTPVNWLLRIFVMSNVKKIKNELKQCWSLAENLIVFSIMCTINALFLVQKVQGFQNTENELVFTHSIQLTYLLGFAEYILDLIFIFKFRQSCVKYFQLYGHIDKILTDPNFTEMRSINIVTVVSLILTFLFTSILDYFSWLRGFGWFTPTLYSIDYVYIFINSLTVLDVATNVIQIEYRMKVMLELIEKYTSSLPVLEGSLSLNLDVLENRDIEIKRVDRLNTVSYSKTLKILSLSKYYLLLTDQVNYINTAFGIRLGAFCLNNIIYVTHLTNVVIRLLAGQFFHPQPKLTVVSTVIRIMNYVCLPVVLVHRCGQTYKQTAGVVRAIDLAVITKKIPADFKTSLLELRALIFSRPIKFHGAYFFTLDYPLLVSIASVVVTYSIILLQSMQ